ncbi:hypothetical protein KIN20_033968 [Parelaphostrongylus tenuis]|nr:hypothetical protein KIN20_033968 [Parelaphostrongylus tenuis]
MVIEVVCWHASSENVHVHLTVLKKTKQFTAERRPTSRHETRASRLARIKPPPSKTMAILKTNGRCAEVRTICKDGPFKYPYKSSFDSPKFDTFDAILYF